MNEEIDGHMMFDLFEPESTEPVPAPAPREPERFSPFNNFVCAPDPIGKLPRSVINARNMGRVIE